MAGATRMEQSDPDRSRTSRLEEKLTRAVMLLVAATAMERRGPVQR
jgi:hypothetical protein